AKLNTIAATPDPMDINNGNHGSRAFLTDFIFSTTAGIDSAKLVSTSSNFSPNNATISRISGNPFSTNIWSIAWMTFTTPRVTAACILSKEAPQLAPASLAAPAIGGNESEIGRAHV